MGLLMVHDPDMVHDGCLLLWAVWCQWWKQVCRGTFSMGFCLVCRCNMAGDGYVSWYGVVARDMKDMDELIFVVPMSMCRFVTLITAGLEDIGLV